MELAIINGTYRDSNTKVAAAAGTVRGTCLVTRIFYVFATRILNKLREIESRISKAVLIRDINLMRVKKFTYYYFIYIYLCSIFIISYRIREKHLMIDAFKKKDVRGINGHYLTHIN